MFDKEFYLYVFVFFVSVVVLVWAGGWHALKGVAYLVVSLAIIEAVRRIFGIYWSWLGIALMLFVYYRFRNFFIKKDR